MKKIVVNGTFDILHVGHVKLLNYAKSLGDHLLVCIDTDLRVKELKGSSRPIYTQEDRCAILLNLKAVDDVKFFNSQEELISILEEYQADAMVKGSDYRGKSIIGKANCKEVIYYDRIEQYSTTSTIQHIVDRG